MANQTTIAAGLQDKIDSKAAIKAAIEAKGVTVGTVKLSDYASKVAGIQQLNTSDATATAAELIYGKTAYVNGSKITGQGGYWQWAASIPLGNPAITGEIIIYAPNVLILASSFLNATNVQIIRLTTGTITTYLSSTFYNCSRLILVEFNVNTSIATNFTQTFGNCPLLVTISGTPLNLTAATSTTNMFVGCTALQNVSFAPSTIKIAISFVASSLLTTTSLLSIANGLSASNISTLTMHATSKTNMNNIIVDNVAGVAVLGSTMTLTAYINNIKGWTIA